VCRAAALAMLAPPAAPTPAPECAAAASAAAAAAFLSSVPEKAVFNQYWYSTLTIAALVGEIDRLCARAAGGPQGGAPPAPSPARVAFLCTPSLFFAFPAATRAARGYALLDVDAVAFGGAAGFTRWDFMAAAAGGEELPPRLAGAFDAVVVDPPFISAECWAAAARSVRGLLGAGGEAGDLGGGKVIATSVRENEALLARLLGARRTAFRPCIPRLVYQYDTFVAGFEPQVLGACNAEVPEE